MVRALSTRMVMSRMVMVCTRALGSGGSRAWRLSANGTRAHAQGAQSTHGLGVRGHTESESESSISFVSREFREHVVQRRRLQRSLRSAQFMVRLCRVISP